MSVAVASVKLTCGSRTEEVVALYTSACGISSMSERLAEKLGIVHGNAVRIKNAGTGYFGHMPDRATDVEYSIHRATVGEVIVSVPVAFLIIPNPYDELVLGEDWIEEMQRAEAEMVILSGWGDGPIYAPNLSYLRIFTGTPTRGPGFSPDFGGSISHIIGIEKDDKSALKKLVQDEK